MRELVDGGVKDVIRLWRYINYFWLNENAENLTMVFFSSLEKERVVAFKRPNEWKYSSW